MVEKYGDAGGYERYMGAWSTPLSALFLDYAAITPEDEILDVGCGTGNLLAVLLERHADARLSGVDPSPQLLARARERPELAAATLVSGRVEQLPFVDGRFGATLSMLVLQEFADRSQALAEMRRVTRPGGVIAACQWDFARMPVIATLIDGIAAADPAACERINLKSSPAFGDEAELAACWRSAGLKAVSTGRLTVTRSFSSFEAIWAPLLAGSTPSTLELASLPSALRERVRAYLRAAFDPLQTDGPIAVTTEALSVRGIV